MGRLNKVLRNLYYMPGFVKIPRDEARWAKAKEAAGKSTKKDSESYWKLSNYIYHKMGKTEEDSRLAKEYFAQLDKTEKLSIENSKSFNMGDMPEQQSIRGNEVTMSDEKKYSAKEAAEAVLKKAEEMLKSSKLFNKSEEIPKTAAATPEVAPPDTVQHQAAPENNPHEQKEGNNPEWGTAPGIKGHVKLAKFCGHIEAKRKKPAAPGV